MKIFFKKQYLTFVVFAVALIATSLITLYIFFEQQSKAPSFSLTNMNGKTLQLSDYKGSTMVVNFWASWCAPCREEIPAMNRAKAALANTNVSMLAINYGENKQSVAEFLEHTPIDFTVLLDEQNTASKAWNITAMPTTIIIDNKGHIIERILGPREWDSPEMIAKIRSIASDSH